MTRVAPQAQRRESEDSSLEALLSNLGQDVVQVVAAPHGLDVPVGDLVIYDSTESSAISEGALVLGAGVRPDTPHGESMLEAAASGHACAR